MYVSFNFQPHAGMMDRHSSSLLKCWQGTACWALTRFCAVQFPISMLTCSDQTPQCILLERLLASRHQKVPCMSSIMESGTLLPGEAQAGSAEKDSARNRWCPRCMCDRVAWARKDWNGGRWHDRWGQLLWVVVSCDWAVWCSTLCRISASVSTDDTAPEAHQNFKRFTICQALHIFEGFLLATWLRQSVSISTLSLFKPETCTVAKLVL